MKTNLLKTTLFAITIAAGYGTSAHASTLAILCAEGGTPCPSATPLASYFTGITSFDVSSSTPTLLDLSGFDAVLVGTDSSPADATALGNVLADYYDLGGKALTITTFGFSNPWEVDGRITTGSYASLTNLGVNGDVSGSIVALVPGDPIFNGVNLAAVTIYHNSNYAHPGLGVGATMLADDGAGVGMIARSANGVIGVNVFDESTTSNNDEFYKLLANTLGGSSAVPEPSTVVLIGMGMVAFAGLRRRRTQ